MFFKTYYIQLYHPIAFYNNFTSSHAPLHFDASSWVQDMSVDIYINTWRHSIIIEVKMIYSFVNTGT